MDEFYWEDRRRYYAALDAVRQKGDDLTAWLEYCGEGLQYTLERVWERIGHLSIVTAREKLGAMDLLRPLLKAGLVRRVGTLKTGRYILE